MHHRHHVCCVIAVAACALCHFALCVENNDSLVMGVPKREFVRVISDIMSGPQPKDINQEIEEDDSDRRKGNVKFGSSQESEQKALRSLRRKGTQMKRDSFYYLQRHVESRDGPEYARYSRGAVSMGAASAGGVGENGNQDSAFSWFLQPNANLRGRRSTSSRRGNTRYTRYGDDGYSSGNVAP